MGASWQDRSVNKPPAFQFYVKDWLASERVSLMSGCAEGLYVRLLALCWDNGSLPADEAILKTLAPKHRRCWAKCWPQVRPSFEKRGARLVHLKLAKQQKRLRELSATRAEAGTKGAQVRSKSQAIAKQVLSPAVAVASAVAVAPKSKTSSAPAAPRPTWLSPFAKAWQSAYGGSPNFGELAKHLKPLTETHLPGEVLDHWTRYLAATEARYASPARFAQTFGAWAKVDRSTQKSVPDMYLTLEQQEARRARARQQVPQDDVSVFVQAAKGGA